MINSSFPCIQLPDVICVQPVYQHHKSQRIQLHQLTAAVSVDVLPVQVQWKYTLKCSSVYLNVIRQMLRWTCHGRYMYRFQRETLSIFIPSKRLTIKCAIIDEMRITTTLLARLLLLLHLGCHQLWSKLTPHVVLYIPSEKVVRLGMFVWVNEWMGGVAN